MRVAVADDGHRSPAELSERKRGLYDALRNDGHYVTLMPFDSGLCAGRNLIVTNIATPYVLVGDDDFSYDESAGVERMLAFLDAHPDIDLIGGRVIENGTLRNYQGFLDMSDPTHFRISSLDLDHAEYRSDGDGLRWTPCDITFNFFLARTDVVRAIQWDPLIKVAYEHSSFFFDMKKAGKTVAFTPDCVVVHKPQDVHMQPSDRTEYLHYRSRKSDKRRFFERFNVSAVTDMRGRLDTPPEETVRSIRYCVKTLLRPASLERLIMSIARFTPQADVIVGDDGPKFDAEFYRGLWDRAQKAGLRKRPVAHNLGRDVGLAAGRNALIDKAGADYVMLLDDDLVFTKGTRIGDLVTVLESDPTLGVACGKLLTPDGYEQHFEGFIERNGRTVSLVDRETDMDTADGVRFRRVDIGFNFALFRRQVFDDIRWDPVFKINCEHGDFFLRLKEETPWKVAYVPSCTAVHAQEYPEGYKQLRRRDEFFSHFFTKHSVDRYDIFGHVVELDPETGGLKRSRV
ncbi:MAG: glycosyltransferase [Candidatus Paceibacterota bacterium]